MVSQAPQLGQIPIVRHQHAPIAEATEVLLGKEGKAADCAHGARLFHARRAQVRCADGLGAILDDGTP